MVTTILLSLSNINSKSELLKLIFAPDKPVVYKEDDNYGYLDIDGKVLIEANYHSATPFYGEYALVSFYDDEDEIYEIIDKKGKTILRTSPTSQPHYYGEYGVWLIDNKMYTYEMKEISLGNCHIEYLGHGFFSYLDNDSSSSGIVDASGKKIFTWDEDYISVDISDVDYPTNDYYAGVSNYEEREEIVSLADGKSVYVLDDTKNRYLEVESDNVFRIIDRSDNYKTVEWLYLEKGKVAFRTTDDIYEITIDDFGHDILKIDYGVNYANSNHDERYAYYDVQNNRYLDETYLKEENIDKNAWMEDIYDYKIYTCDKLYGIMQKNKIIKACAYTSIDLLDRNTYEYLKEYHARHLAILKDNSTVEIYDMKRGQVLHSYEMSSIKGEKDSSFFLITQFDESGYTAAKYIVYNAITDEQMEFSSPSRISLYSNYITVEDKDTTTYYNTDFTKIYEVSN